MERRYDMSTINTLTQDQGPTIFARGPGDGTGPIITIRRSEVTAIEANGEIVVDLGDTQSASAGVDVSAPNNGRGVDALASFEFGTGVTGRGMIGVSGQGTEASGGAGVDASGLVGVKAKGSSSFNGGTGVDASGLVGVKARGISLYNVGTTGVEASGSTGIRAEGDKTEGSFGAGVIASGDLAVVARGTTTGVDATGEDTAVAGISTKGYGGHFGGGKAPIRLFPAHSAGAPEAASGVHLRGELYVDKDGLLFFCIADGTPGTWRKVVLQ
jgi:hypothetical protein